MAVGDGQGRGQVEQENGSRPASAFADMLKQSGYDGLEYLYQEGGKEEEGFRFRQTQKSEGYASLTPASCIVKLFTATMVGRLVREGRLDLQQKVPEALRTNCKINSALPAEISELKIKDLLAHTHGLGSSLSQIAPMGDDGFISLRGVMDRIQLEGVLFPPGKFHSYANVGYHILGLLIEGMYGKLFSQVIRDDILEVLQNKYPHATEALYATGSAQVCPASGVGLYVSGRLLLTFAQVLLNEGGRPLGLCEESVRMLMAPIARMPSWSPFVNGTGLGWKDYGHGWSGHNGATRNSLVLLRVNMSENHIIALSGKTTLGNNGLSSMAMAMMKRTFPGLYESSMRPPKPRATVTAADSQKIAGEFGGPFLKYIVEANGEEIVLSIHIATATSAFQSVHRCALIPGDGNVFFLTKPWRMIMFLEVIDDAEGDARYLWDHECVWPEKK